MKYTYLEHRADLYIQGEGRDRNEALEAVAQGLFNIIGKGDEENKMKIIETGIDFQDLVVNIFTRILGEIDAEMVSGAKILIKEITDTRGEVEFYYGENKNQTHVKAVTLHGFEEIKEKDKIKIKILFDT